MDLDWDPDKDAASRRKHSVGFADAVTALEDEFALTAPDPHAEGEARFVSLGVDAHGRLLVTVFTEREDHICIISSRTDSRGEIKRYEDHS